MKGVKTSSFIHSVVLRLNGSFLSFIFTQKSLFFLCYNRQGESGYLSGAGVTFPVVNAFTAGICSLL